jgi:hypothetical protein
MEGGNSAIDPSTRRADYVDDLSLLTTRVSPTGALLTTTADLAQRQHSLQGMRRLSGPIIPNCGPKASVVFWRIPHDGPMECLRNSLMQSGIIAFVAMDLAFPIFGGHSGVRPTPQH